VPAPDLIGAFGRYDNPDALAASKGLELYDRMQEDGQVKACLSIKKSAVLSRGWKVESDEGTSSDVVEFCRWALEAIDGSMLTVLWNVCDAIAKGYSIQSLVWDVCKSGEWSGKWYLSYIKPMDPSHWGFDVDAYKNVVALRELVSDKTVDRSRFVVYTYHPEYGNPYGHSDLTAAYRNWWSKDFLVRFWNLYLEKYGSPTAKGSYKRGTPLAAQQEFLRVLSAIQQQSAVVIPDDCAVELLETIRQGDVGYRLAVGFHDKEIAKAILNMTLITDTDNNGVGSFAMAKVHLDVLHMCLMTLKRDLEETVVREQILRPLVRYNFGADAAVPLFTLGPMEDREIGVLSKVVSEMITAGVLKPDDPWIRTFLGLEGAGPAPARGIVPSVTRQHDGPVGNGNDVRVKVAP
jgi:phage gp29-like protein